MRELIVVGLGVVMLTVGCGGRVDDPGVAAQAEPTAVATPSHVVEHVPYVVRAEALPSEGCSSFNAIASCNEGDVIAFGACSLPSNADGFRVVTNASSVEGWRCVATTSTPAAAGDASRLVAEVFCLTSPKTR